MKVEKIMKRGNKDAKVFDGEVIQYIVKQYNCDEELVKVRLQQCLGYGYAICETKDNNNIVGIQTNYDRSEIYIGR